MEKTNSFSSEAAPTSVQPQPPPGYYHQSTQPGYIFGHHNSLRNDYANPAPIRQPLLSNHSHDSLSQHYAPQGTMSPRWAPVPRLSSRPSPNDQPSYWTPSIASHNCDASERLQHPQHWPAQYGPKAEQSKHLRDEGEKQRKKGRNNVAISGGLLGFALTGRLTGAAAGAMMGKMLAKHSRDK